MMSEVELQELLVQKIRQYAEVVKWFEEEYDSSCHKDTVAEWEKNGYEFKAQIKLLRFILWGHSN
jgi:hypothetical protein